jgi:hypothetical protein
MKPRTLVTLISTVLAVYRALRLLRDARSQRDNLRYLDAALNAAAAVTGAVLAFRALTDTDDSDEGLV